MIIHTMKLSVNGQTLSRGFSFKHPWIVLDQQYIGYSIAATDGVFLEVEYHYKSDRGDLLDNLVDQSYAKGDESKQILSAHFVDGHFALDNELYKEAISNFGTVVEAMVNRKMSKDGLAALIDKDPTALMSPPIQQHMRDIKDMRNRVHPNWIADYGHISREDAEDARYKLQEIILHYYNAVNL